MAHHQEIFIDVLLRNSTSKLYTEAVKEWSYDDNHVELEDGLDDEYCICTHRIRHLFQIYHNTTGVTLTIGCECIKHVNEYSYERAKQIMAQYISKKNKALKEKKKKEKEELEKIKRQEEERKRIEKEELERKNKIILEFKKNFNDNIRTPNFMKLNILEKLHTLNLLNDFEYNFLTSWSIHGREKDLLSEKQIVVLERITNKVKKININIIEF